MARMPDDRRRQLVHVAATEFAAAGYGAASLNRIIGICGMSKSSFYYFVPSKADLFEFVVGELIATVGAALTIPGPQDFSGAQFWPRLAQFYAELLAVAQREPAFLTLGRMFYSDAPQDAAGAVNRTWAAVQDWLHGVLAVGRRSGAVRGDLPDALQYNLILRILQVFDEWTVAHYEALPSADLAALADAQFATVRRVLEPEA